MSINYAEKKSNIVIKYLFENTYEIWMSKFLADKVSILPGVYKVNFDDNPKYIITLDPRYNSKDVLNSIKELAEYEQD